ncbi:MAG: hypothetical protein IZT59_06800 [Verrucomicrobia bacterium]|nr:hypothetical protein [Verrucomicrobiota bacterium]
MRTFLILVVIVTSGFIFVRLTAAPKLEAGNAPDEGAISAPVNAIVAKVFLTLSGEAVKVAVEGVAGAIVFKETSSGKYSGEVAIDGEAALLFVLVSWKTEGDAHRFAKLVVEAPGKETFTHVFDAPGDIDDFIELPF